MFDWILNKWDPAISGEKLIFMTIHDVVLFTAIGFANKWEQLTPQICFFFTKRMHTVEILMLNRYSLNLTPHFSSSFYPYCAILLFCAI